MSFYFLPFFVSGLMIDFTQKVRLWKNWL